MGCRDMRPPFYAPPSHRGLRHGFPTKIFLALSLLALGPYSLSGGATQEKVETFGSTSPLGRPGQPAELAGIYVRLAENDGSYTTGNIYGAGGGQGQP